tara:strand:+ start:288 stop:551 length:264 start_codon:yes stop_codon:yes gene_type:complete
MYTASIWFYAVFYKSDDSKEQLGCCDNVVKFDSLDEAKDYIEALIGDRNMKFANSKLCIHTENFGSCENVLTIESHNFELSEIIKCK